MLDWKIYKEGQGVWARNSVAATIAILAVFAAVELFEYLTPPNSEQILDSFFVNLDVYNWPIDYRFVIVGPFLLAMLAFAFWQYNHPQWSDFLIDTEAEMKNRVTWPTKKEQMNASIVVIVAVVLFGGFIFLSDLLLALAFDWVVYGAI